MNRNSVWTGEMGIPNQIPRRRPHGTKCFGCDITCLQQQN